MSQTGGNMSAINHLRELRKRVFSSVIGTLICAIPAFILYDFFVYLFSQPFASLPQNGLSQQLFVNSILEGFFIKFKFAFIFGLLFSLPLHLFHIIRFVFPGLKRREKLFIIVSLIVSLLLSAISLYFGYFWVLPISVQFLTSSQFIPENIGILLNFHHNIFYVLQVLFYGFVAFQFPILLEVLLFLNILNRKQILRSSRYIIVGIFILSAIVTPPDVITQLSLSLPLIGLFFLTLLIAKIFGWGETPCSA